MDSLWREKRGPIWTFFCPLCRSARALPFRPRPGGFHHVQVLTAAAFSMILTWTWFGWKGIVAYVPFWVVFETAYRARVRAKLSCPHCGFDPYLYKLDVARARGEVEQHWRKKFAEKGIPYPESPRPDQMI